MMQYHLGIKRLILKPLGIKYKTNSTVTLSISSNELIERTNSSNELTVTLTSKCMVNALGIRFTLITSNNSSVSLIKISIQS